jgi:hypothetical protein
MIKHIFTLFSFALIFSSCDSDYEAEVKKSKKLDNYLKGEKLPSLDNSYIEMLLRLGKKSNVVMVADTLYLETKRVSKLIDSIIVFAENNDSIGSRCDVGNNYLIQSPTGYRLTEGANSVYQLCLRSIKDLKKVELIRNKFSKYKRLGTIEFNQVYFSKSSTAFIVMTLRGLRNELLKAADFCLNISKTS